MDLPQQQHEDFFPTFSIQKMSFLDNAKRYLNFIVFFSASIVSIGFSSWQFQLDKGDTSWTPSWSSICNDFPFDMLRRKFPSNL